MATAIRSARRKSDNPKTRQSPKNAKGRGKAKKTCVLQKPKGVIAPRVKKVGGERFGIVCIDPAKKRSRWLMADFYQNVLIEPATVEHSQRHYAAAVKTLRQAKRKHKIKDIIVVVERTGRYHQEVKRAFSEAGFDTRIMHPFVTKQHRVSANPNCKTDDTDLMAMLRAATLGFGLAEEPWSVIYQRLQLLVRHRRDLVDKRTALYCQIQEHLHIAMPQYATYFSSIWVSKIALPIARRFGSPQAVRQAGGEGLVAYLHEQHIRVRRPDIEKVLNWSATIGSTPAEAALHHEFFLRLDADRIAKEDEILQMQCAIAHCLVQTPYILLVAIPGIAIVSAADLAGEMGPIEHYANANAITGRCGLYPGRYQSDETDNPNGKMLRNCNRRMRAALMRMADNLGKKNTYFHTNLVQWREAKTDERVMRVRIAKNLARLIIPCVGNRELLRHPCCQTRDYILQKLIGFHHRHNISHAEIQRNLELAWLQLPSVARPPELDFLQHELNKETCRRSLRPIGEVIRLVMKNIVDRQTSESASPK